MIPIPLILAMIATLALRPSPFGAPLAEGGNLLVGTAKVAAVVALVALASLAAGSFLVRRLRRPDSSFVRMRKRYARLGRLLDLLNLAAFCWILHGLNWMAIVDTGLGLSRAVLLDEFLLLLPFLVGQILVWASLIPAERLLRRKLDDAPEVRSLVSEILLKARASYGLILPSVAMYTLVIDLLFRFAPRLASHSLAPFFTTLTFGAAILVLAPLLVRLAWPTRSLEPGPLRDRLNALSTRLGFRHRDILVWDTGGLVANAGVTGLLPWFRYVLLTDALIDRLEPLQIEAVFGHEVGHIAHRHLSYFGFFFVGSIGVLALLGELFDWLLALLPLDLATLGPESSWPMVIETVAVLGCLGLLAAYVYVVFGYLSRRFERQADVYGCRAVSCGLPECSPFQHHADGEPGLATAGSSAQPGVLCPVGIRTFTQSLASVALMNGIELESRSWRHGSIARRIHFLLDLEGRPEAEVRFQLRLKLLRLALASALIVVVITAAATGALSHI